MFKFEIGSYVKLNFSDERGEVIGRAEYLDKDRRYLIRYKAGDGCLVENWWAASALKYR